MDLKQFSPIVDTVIDNFEGGYFHPDMLLDGRVKDPNHLLSAGEGRKASAETMFGIDRINGYGDLSIYPEWKSFWSIIDNANARKNWKYMSNGGTFEKPLKELVDSMIFKHNNNLGKKYLTPEAKLIVDSNKNLTLHFIYASWNGSGWYSKFARIINEAIKKGIKDPKKLEQIAIDSRVKEGYKKGSKPNPLLVQTGEKMEKLFKGISTGVAKGISKFTASSKNNLNTIIPIFLIAFIIVTLYILTYKQII